MYEPEVEMGFTVVARPPSPDCVACQGSGRMRDNHYFLKVGGSVGNEAEGAPRQGHYTPHSDQGFLAEGGWHIENAGTTGKPVGRPTRGITNPGGIEVATESLLLSADRWLARMVLTLSQSDTLPAGWMPTGTNGRKGNGHKTARALFVACLNEHVNTEAIGARYAKDASLVRRYSKQGREWIADNLTLLCLTVPQGAVAPLPENSPANSPKGGGVEMSASAAYEIITRLDRIERLEAMRAETMDSVRATVERIAERFPDDERIQERAAEFLDES